MAVGGISRETNTYCRDRTHHEHLVIWQADAINSWRGIRWYLDGIDDATQTIGTEFIRAYLARTTPSRTIARQAYQAMLGRLTSDIKQALLVDAIALATQGAGVAEGNDGLEGHLCQAVRAVVGSVVKIVEGFDLQGNTARQMADSIDLTSIATANAAFTHAAAGLAD